MIVHVAFLAVQVVIIRVVYRKQVTLISVQLAHFIGRANVSLGTEKNKIKKALKKDELTYLSLSITDYRSIDL
jgi:hypothetical protein